MSSTVTSTTTLQAKLNTPSTGKFDDALIRAPIGDILAVLLSAATATQTGITEITVTSNKGQLAQSPTPNGLLSVTATGTPGGVKQIVIDPTAVLVTGQVYWDGGINLTFAAVDVVTACSALYCKSDGSQLVSTLMQIVAP